MPEEGKAQTASGEEHDGESWMDATADVHETDAPLLLCFFLHEHARPRGFATKNSSLCMHSVNCCTV